MYRPKIMNKWNAVLKICIAFLCISSTLYAREIDLSDSKLLVSPSIKSPVNETIIQVLQEEIHKRTDIHLDIADGWSDSPIIALALSSDEILNGKPLPEKTQLSLQAESFSVVVQEETSPPVLWLIGTDETWCFIRRRSSAANGIIHQQAVPVRFLKCHPKHTGLSHPWASVGLSQYG